MAINTLYVGVGNVKAMQSSLWRIWTEKDEVYVLARKEAGEFYKLSLHSSGISRLAYLTGKEIKDPVIFDNDPRLIWRWKPKDSIGGWNRRLDIIIPAIPISEHFPLKSRDMPKGTINWLDSLPLGYRQQITLLIADSPSQVPDEVLIKDDKIIGSLPLNNGKVVWIRGRRESMSKEEQDQYEKNDIKINIDPQENKESITLAAVVEVDKGSLHPVIINYALGLDRVITKL